MGKDGVNYTALVRADSIDITNPDNNGAGTYLSLSNGTSVRVAQCPETLYELINEE